MLHSSRQIPAIHSLHRETGVPFVAEESIGFVRIEREGIVFPFCFRLNWKFCQKFSGRTARLFSAGAFVVRESAPVVGT
jgi:hypothetical protein